VGAGGGGGGGSGSSGWSGSCVGTSTGAGASVTTGATCLRRQPKPASSTRIQIRTRQLCERTRTKYTFAVTREEQLRLYRWTATLGGIALLIVAAPGLCSRLVREKPWDGLVDWWGAKAFWEGADPYSKEWLAKVGAEGLGHPPTTAFYALPLALLPLSWMSMVLGTIVIFLLAHELVTLANELGAPEPQATATLAMGLLIAAPFMSNHLVIAQISALIGYLFFFAWRALRTNQEVKAGIALGFACTMKLFPGLMVLYLLLCRRWRGVIAAGLTWLSVAAFMTARFGVKAWTEYSRSEKRIVDYWIGHASNASVHGIVLRILHPACDGQPVSDPHATLIAAVIALTLLVLFVWLSRPIAIGTMRGDLSFSLFVLLSLFANPFFFEHYNVILIFPIAVATAALLRAPLSNRQRLIGGALLLGAIVCLRLPGNTARVLLYFVKTRPEIHLFAHWREIQTAAPVPLLIILTVLLLRRWRSVGESA
jgi:alpha-1,2-mannosyltransferase